LLALQEKGNISILMDEFSRAVQGQPAVSENAAISVIVSLCLAALLGTYLAVIYHFTYTGKKDNRGQMVYTLILLCLGGALVWLIVADHLVRAFGLAGALAMIRYRTRMQDPKDTTMVFFAIILGMACGLHQYFIAVYGAAFVGLVLWLIKLTNDYTSLSRPRGAANGKVDSSNNTEIGAKNSLEGEEHDSPSLQSSHRADEDESVIIENNPDPNGETGSEDQSKPG